MAISQELTILASLESDIADNKVANLAYTQQAYNNNEVGSVSDYDYSRGRNIPVGTASMMKVDQTVIDKGWRAQLASLVLTRMLANHFFGRLSYNVNKIHDNLLSLINSLKGALGTANGVATLDANGYIEDSQMPLSVNGVTKNANREITVKTNIIETQNLTAPDLSQSGMTWAQSNKTTGSTNKSYYYHGLWVVVGSPDAVAKLGIWWSGNDGRTWTQGSAYSELLYQNYSFSCICHVGNLWLAGGVKGIFYSYDGKTWYQASGSSSGPDFTNINSIISFYDITSGNTYLLAGGNCFWITTTVNPQYWSGYLPVPSASNFVHVILCQAELSSTYKIIVSRIGLQGMYWSVDAHNWYACTGATLTNVNVCVYADGMFVAGGVQGENGQNLRWSTDGKDWHLITLSSQNVFIYSLAYADGLWVAGTSQGIWWSEDGKNWTVSNIATAYYTGGVLKTSGVWIASSTSGIFMSVNGKNWTQSSITSGVYSNMNQQHGVTIVGGSSDQGLLYDVPPATKNVEKILDYVKVRAESA